MSLTFTWGGKTAEQLGLELMDANTVLPGTAPTRDYLMPIAGKHGSRDFGADLGPAIFELDCLTIDLVADFRQVIRTLNEHMLDTSGRPKTMPLILSNEPAAVYQARYAGQLEIDKSTGPVYRRILLPLIAPDPHAYETESTEEKTITTSPGELEFTVGGNTGTPAIITIKNEGGNTISGFILTRVTPTEE